MLNCSANYKEDHGMEPSMRDGLVPGVVLGLVVAFGFALVIRAVPPDWLTGTTARAILYALQVPAGLLFVPVAGAIARRSGHSPRGVLLWACCGALAFDGLVLGFWPALYGQAGAAQAAVAALLLWAFAWILAAALVAAPDRRGVA
jgi:hypothetical protein